MLQRIESAGVAYWTDVGLRDESGVVIAFSERLGGVSLAPHASLNLAAHVGDDPSRVDENRYRFLSALGLGEMQPALTTCEQVHGDVIAEVGYPQRGSGAFASLRSVCRDSSEPAVPPLAGCDALVTKTPEIPLMLFFADCVPVVLVAPGPAVAVAHAGWRGALAGLPGLAAKRLASAAGVSTASIRAYIGPHIGPCHYEVSVDVLSLFTASFGNLSRAESGGLDLGAVVNASLIRSGVDSCSIAALGTCTAESTECFYSYRAEGGLTGRHGALACILP